MMRSACKLILITNVMFIGTAVDAKPAMDPPPSADIPREKT